MGRNYRARLFRTSVVVLLVAALAYVVGVVAAPTVAVAGVLAGASAVLLLAFGVSYPSATLAVAWLVPALVAAMVVLSGSAAELRANAARLALLAVAAAFLWRVPAYAAALSERLRG